MCPKNHENKKHTYSQIAGMLRLLSRIAPFLKSGRKPLIGYFGLAWLETLMKCASIGSFDIVCFPSLDLTARMLYRMRR